MLALSGVWMGLCQLPAGKVVASYLSQHGSHFWDCVTFSKERHGESVTKPDHYYYYYYYKDVNLHLRPKYKKHRLQVFTIEISVLGFISNLNDFCTFFKIPNMPISLKTEIIKTVIVNIYSSYNIYCKRNSNL